jgi:DNA-binding NtrC family response regulator
VVRNLSVPPDQAFDMDEAILVVDDEPFVVSVVCRILQNAGFTVLSAISATHALAVAERFQGPIALMLSDVVMPGLSGPALAELFTLMRPETKCLFMAGFPDTPEVCDRILGPGHPFLPKPFDAQQLVAKVRDVLARPSTNCLSAGASAASL